MNLSYDRTFVLLSFAGITIFATTHLLLLLPDFDIITIKGRD
nr:MAG TPA: hypothetical protein [Caudoviricetes sp.]